MGAPGDTAYLILIGLNIEICMMFFILGMACRHTLPEDKDTRRSWASPTGSSMRVGYSFCGLIEILLNAVGALTWDYSWWRRGRPGSSS